jgi:outer membrane protein OmpA-like peptidoglycan-associated protein/opacity protein-like surface antigen
MRITIVALVALLLVAASPAFAGGGEKGDWELGVYGGYGWLDDYGFFHPKDHFLYGARFGHFLSNHWSLEFSAQRLKTDTEPDILGMPVTDFKISSLRLNALYNLGEPGKAVRPFLTAGIGQEKTSVEDFGESCDFGWNAGAGLRLFLSPHVNLRMDGRYVRTKVGDAIDESQGNVEATLGLGLLFGGKKKEVAAAPVEAPPANRPPTVSCAADRAETLPGETVGLHVTASDPENDPLTYEWSATGGRVTGTGATATLDFTGVNPPANATITVRVSDNHGNTATSDCAVRLLEPAKPAAAVSCIAGGFPRNLSGISNVDKACLDDVAQRLSSDPRARVIVIGHADSHESSREIGQRRAEAVKAYLVRERSIDGSRITLRPAVRDTGADAAAQTANRRVEVWFVPEGAAEPK